MGAHHTRPAGRKEGDETANTLDDRLPVDVSALEVMRITREATDFFRAECAARHLPQRMVEKIIYRYFWGAMGTYALECRLYRAAEVLQDDSPERHWDLFQALVIAHQITTPAGARIYDLLYGDKRQRATNKRKAKEPKMAIGAAKRTQKELLKWD